MPPGLAHALLALAIQAIVAAPIAFLLRDGVIALAIGGAVAIGFYAGRERRQSEEWWGSNRIPPWIWKPRAWRDMAWPAVAVAAVAAVAAVMEVVR